MPRWKRPDEQITDGALKMRVWSETKAGIAYRKRQAKYARDWRKNNREKFLAGQRRAYQSMRLEALQKYSRKEIPECACCGETIIEFLQLDHVNGDGAEHRRQIGMAQGVGEQKHRVNVGGNGLPYWLKKHGWPEGFQVLCANCNLGKRCGKQCPHELRR